MNIPGGLPVTENVNPTSQGDTMYLMLASITEMPMDTIMVVQAQEPYPIAAASKEDLVAAKRKVDRSVGMCIIQQGHCMLIQVKEQRRA